MFFSIQHLYTHACIIEAWLNDSPISSAEDNVNVSQTSLGSVSTPNSLQSSVSVRPKSSSSLFGRHNKVAPAPEGELDTGPYSRLKSPGIYTKQMQ